MINEIYTIRYANLDGSDEQTHTIDKADYTGRTIAYHSRLISMKIGTSNLPQPIIKLKTEWCWQPTNQINLIIKIWMNFRPMILV